MNKYCLNCGKELVKRQIKYCSNQCQRDFQYKQKIEDWKNGKFDGLSGEFGISSYIRRYMLEKSNYACEKCGWNLINPTTGLCPLEIHHIDGDYQNNEEVNLQVLCPNCHSLTDNYKSLNISSRDRTNYTNRKSENQCIVCGIAISSQSIRCRKCESENRKIDKPITREELKNLIRTNSFVKIGEQFNVSDNTIRKWCIGFNLPSKKTIINKYNNEEWEKV